MMKFYDNNDDADLTVGLYRKDFITNQLDFVGMIHSGFDFESPSVETEEADLNGLLTEIDNDRYAWYLMCEFDQSVGEPMVLHQVIIKYSK